MPPAPVAAEGRNDKPVAIEPTPDLKSTPGGQPGLLSGEYVGGIEGESQGNDGLGEDGQPASEAPFASLPVISVGLQQQIGDVPSDETLRVIAILRHLPHDRIAKEVRDQHAAERAEIDRQVHDILAVHAARRDPSLPRDGDNIAELMTTWPQEREALKPLHQQHEALDLIIKNEIGEALSSELAPPLDRVSSHIESLGGEVEFTTIAVGMVVARVPAGRIAELAAQPDVIRVVEDGLLHSDLAIMDDATLVSAPGGLWDSGQFGGIYDPAVIDSGLDLNHPGMTNSVSPLRNNFSTWYLVAANGSASFGDAFTPNDLQGHGTHVSGIVGSYGTGAYPNELGMSHGVEKMVTLKAGWLNTSTGRASMFWSDKYNVVNRALYDSGALAPANSFLDDVDGMNLSYGGSTTLGDTDGSRFWDSVISTYPDLPVTISAGNSGPSNSNFNDPAVSYNAITVANANDLNTANRDDDVINPGSSVGPTADDRRKPDISAPGTSIFAPNNDWETEADYINKSGTSMAAPAVLGVIMDLMDAGVFDELRLKAVLINTAQKNEPGMNIENDADGWDPQIGWGLMNALAAYFHRSDVFTDSVTPRDTTGEYQLYSGSMRDEGPTGEGRDRATMVWNRHATYATAAPPSTYYNLVDLNLRLYREANQTLIDTDLDGNDNVHQVRIGSGAGDTDVVIKAYAWSPTFSHGGATQTYALATEDGFTRVDLPTTFQGIALWPGSVEPSEVFDIEFWLRNDSDIASHSNVFDLILPAGWTLISGPASTNVGSIPGDGGTSTHVNYTLRAPGGAPGGLTNIVVQHSHNSYGEQWGAFNWNIGLTVEWDVIPPNPDPMSFSTTPGAVDQSSIDMQAGFASDPHGPVEYYLDFTGSPTGGGGGTDSGWQASRDHTDTGLQSNHSYCFKAWARDSATTPNLTLPSPDSCAFSLIEVPPAPLPGGPSSTGIAVQSLGSFTNLNQGSSGLLVENLTLGTNSGWIPGQVNWTSLGLSPNTQYAFATRSRNGDGIENPVGPSASLFTLAVIPSAAPFGSLTHQSVLVRWGANGNPPGTEYFVENITLGTNSGWTTALEWLDTSTGPDSSYSYLAKARNGNGVETGTTFLGTVTTGFFGDGFESGDTSAWTSTSP